MNKMYECFAISVLTLVSIYRATKSYANEQLIAKPEGSTSLIPKPTTGYNLNWFLPSLCNILLFTYFILMLKYFPEQTVSKHKYNLCFTKEVVS